MLLVLVVQRQPVYSSNHHYFQLRITFITQNSLPVPLGMMGSLPQGYNFPLGANQQFPPAMMQGTVGMGAQGALDPSLMGANFQQLNSLMRGYDMGGDMGGFPHMWHVVDTTWNAALIESMALGR